MEENFSMEWNMEENFSMEWKILGMEWKKIAGMEYGKIVFHFIPYHALLSGLTYLWIYPIALPLVATLELTLQYTTSQGKKWSVDGVGQKFQLTANQISINSLLLHCAEAEPISASLSPGKHLFLK